VVVACLGAWLALDFRAPAQPAKRRSTAHAALPQHVLEATPAVPLPTPTTPRRGQARTAPPPSPERPKTLEEQLTEGLPSWEGKSMADYTVEEREATGLTNEKLFANAGGANWRVLASALEGKLDEHLLAEMLALADSYMDAAAPYAPHGTEDNVAQERHLLPRVVASLAAMDLDPDAKRSLDYLKHHVEMWNTGEAEKLVDRKIEKENDGAKRLALRARNESSRDGEESGVDEDDGQ
jgi:hypothetical protein